VKEQLALILAGFQSLVDNYQIRDEGIVTYRTQMVALQAIIDAPDAVTATVVQTVVADGKLDAITAALASLQDAVATVIHNTAPAWLAPATAAPAVPVPGAANPAL
jgi:hypothetical protein